MDGTSDDFKDSDSKFYKSLYMNSKSIMLLIDPLDGQIIDANQAALDFYGYSRSEILKMKIKEINVLPCEEVQNEMNNAKIEKRNHFLFKHYTSRGDIHDVEVYSNPIEIDGKIYLYSIIHDITRQVQLEKNNKELVDQSIASLGILGAGIAHDYNNILQVMLSNIELLKKDKNIGQNSKQKIDTLHNSILEAIKITNQLSVFTEGGFLPSKTHLIKDILEETVSFCTSGSNVKCEISYCNPIPYINVDINQIKRVFNNILINAIQASSNPKDIIKINVDLAEEKNSSTDKFDTYVKISFIDQGIGIEKRNLKKIFHPFYSTKEQSGLGLAIVKSIINNYNGKIQVSSEKGQGTQFDVYLPNAMEPNNDIEEEVEQGSVYGGVILLLDDKENIHEVLRMFLEELGFEVLSTYEGNETINLYKKYFDQKKKIDIVILDLTIPGGLGGKEVVVKIKELNPQQKVIVSSGYSKGPIISNYKEYGFDGVLVKPFNFEILENELSKLNKSSK